jgi:hypothetical protein
MSTTSLVDVVPRPVMLEALAGIVAPRLKSGQLAESSGDLVSMKLRIQNLGRALRYFVTHGRFCQHEKMGSWWECNHGLDEVRMCSACDRIEKRVIMIELPT